MSPRGAAGHCFQGFVASGGGMLFVLPFAMLLLVVAILPLLFCIVYSAVRNDVAGYDGTVRLNVAVIPGTASYDVTDYDDTARHDVAG